MFSPDILNNFIKNFMRSILLLVLVLEINTIILCQSRISKSNRYNSLKVEDVLDYPEEKINIGLWSLIIAKEYDNKTDVEKYLKTLDSMTNEIKKMLAGRTNDMDKFLSVKTFLYEAGKWNDNKPFSYDLNDPLGNVLEHQLLSNYIDSRNGNCVSMPTLFLALMERLDQSVPFIGVKVPRHLFCRLKDRQTNDIWNVETTNGGNPARNQWYIEQMEISKAALDNKTYLKDLSKKEYIAELIGTLITKERENGNFERAMKYADLVLKLSPNSDVGLVNKAALYAEIASKKAKEKELTSEENEYYRNESTKYIEKAKALGWKPESEEEREQYLNSIKKETNKQLKKEGK
jgi:regulator of sirC expression with transglutaminase-like and TPR domain